GLLPVGQFAHLEAEAALLAGPVLRPHLLDADGEQFLDRRLDLVLGRPGVDLERVGVAVRRLVRALLGDDGPQDDLVGLQLRPPPPRPSQLGPRHHDSPPPVRPSGLTPWPAPARPSSRSPCPCAGPPGPPSSTPAASAAAPCRR